MYETKRRDDTGYDLPVRDYNTGPSVLSESPTEPREVKPIRVMLPVSKIVNFFKRWV